MEARFSLRESNVLLGAPVYVSFEYSNPGPQTISFSIGNGRDDGFRFSCPNEGVEELNPYFEFGGLAGVIVLEPGMKDSQPVLLNRYLRFTGPGEYQIKCEFDPELEDEFLNAKGTVAIRDTVFLRLHEDPEQLKQLIAEFDRDIRDGDPSTQSRQSAILSELRLADTVPVFIHGLKSGNDAAVESAILGLGNLGGRQALDALQDFVASSASPSLSEKAKQEMERISRISS